jgi:hypothetical protein
MVKSVKRSQNFPAVCFGPADRIGVDEFAIFRVGTIGNEAGLQEAGGEVAAGSDIITRKGVYRGSRNRKVPAFTEDAVGISFGGQSLFEVRTGDCGAARNIVPYNERNSGRQISEQGFALLIFIK